MLNIKALGKDTLAKLVLAAIIFTGTLSRIYRLAENSLWLDEASSYHLAKQGVTGVVDILWHTWIVHDAPLFLWLTCLFMKFGDSEWVLRMPSMLAGVIAIPVLYLLGRELMDRAVGLLAAALLSISVFHIYYSQEARVYALFFLLSLLSTYYYLKLLRTETNRDWFYYGLFTLLLMYSHYYSFWIISAQIASFLVAKLLFDQSRRLAQRVRKLKAMAVTLAALAVSFLPWLPEVKNLSTVGYDYHCPSLFSYEYIRDIKYVLAGVSPLGFIYFVLFACGCLCLYKKKKRAELFYFLFILIYSTVFINLQLTSVKMFMATRYFIFLIAPFLLLVASGAVYMYRSMPGPRKRIAAAVLLFVLFVQLQALFAYYQNGFVAGIFAKRDWRLLKRELIQADHQLVIVPLPFFFIKPLAYYFRGEEERVLFANIQERHFEDLQRMIGGCNVVNWYDLQGEIKQNAITIVQPRDSEYCFRTIAEFTEVLAGHGFKTIRSGMVGRIRIIEYRR